MVIDETGKKISDKTGRATGRPAIAFPKEWQEAYKSWKDGKTTATMELLGLKRNTFY